MFHFTTADWRADVVLRQVYANDSVRTAERVRRYSKFMNLPGAHHSFGKTAEQIIPPDAAAFEAQLKTISVPTLGGAVELKVPAGSDAGRKLRLRGRGLPGNPDGDQIVEIEIIAPVPTDEAQKKAYKALAKAFGEKI